MTVFNWILVSIVAPAWLTGCAVVGWTVRVLCRNPRATERRQRRHSDPAHQAETMRTAGVSGEPAKGMYYREDEQIPETLPTGKAFKS